ncbi:MAG: DNA-directed RNA polymerase subunit alpha C-terminal domain-containing protein [Planctomycetota bacterium]
MSSDPLDMVIGSTESVSRDEEASSRHLDAAENLDRGGDREGAISELRKAVAADPHNTGAMFRLAYHLDLKGEEDEAVALYERCCEQAPAPINALMNLAVLYEDRADYVRAERCLRQVLDTSPNHVRARLFMLDVQASREMMVEEESERDVMKRRALLETPVTDFELSVRARTCLKKMNIRTLGDLLRITEAELMSYKNFGESSLEEIRRMLTQKGLRLGQGLEDAHRAARRQIMDKLKGTGKEALLGKPVSDLQLSVRARKALQLLNIQTFGDLVSHTEAELMGVKNFGATSLVEIREKLTEFGLTLRIIDDDEIPAGVGLSSLSGMGGRGPIGSPMDAALEGAAGTTGDIGESDAVESAVDAAAEAVFGTATPDVDPIGSPSGVAEPEAPPVDPVALDTEVAAASPEESSAPVESDAFSAPSEPSTEADGSDDDTPKA